mgnify:CR=1 FL=1
MASSNRLPSDQQLRSDIFAGDRIAVDTANAVFEHLRRRLGVELGQTTTDGMFTLLPVSCIGDCHNAPSMMINCRFYGRLTPSGVDRILEEYRHKPAESARHG